MRSKNKCSRLIGMLFFVFSELKLIVLTKLLDVDLNVSIIHYLILYLPPNLLVIFSERELLNTLLSCYNVPYKRKLCHQINE